MSVLKNQTKKKKTLSDTVAFQPRFNYSFELNNSLCTQLPSLTNKSILSCVQTDLWRPFARVKL